MTNRPFDRNAAITAIRRRGGSFRVDTQCSEGNWSRYEVVVPRPGGRAVRVYGTRTGKVFHNVLSGFKTRGLCAAPDPGMPAELLVLLAAYVAANNFT